MKKDTDTDTARMLHALGPLAEKVRVTLADLGLDKHPFLQNVSRVFPVDAQTLEGCTAIQFLDGFLSNTNTYFGKVNQELGELKKSTDHLYGLVAVRNLFARHGYARVEYVDDISEAKYVEGWNFARPFTKETTRGTVHYQVRNDSPTASQVVVLSGANTSGKSFQLEQMLFMQLVGQSFGYAPAKEAKIFPRDRIFFITRGTTESRNNLSAYGKDHVRWKNALSAAGLRTQIFGDELFSTTSPDDQSHVGYSVCKYGAENGAQIVIATHSEKLIELIRDRDEIDCGFFHLAIELQDGKVRSQYVLSPGVDGSHSIEVARGIGIEPRFIELVEQAVSGNLSPANTGNLGFPAIVGYSEEQRAAMKQEVGSLRSLIPFKNEYVVKENDDPYWDYRSFDIRQRFCSPHDDPYMSGQMQPIRLDSPVYFEPRKASDLFEDIRQDSQVNIMFQSATHDIPLLMERQRFYKELLISGKLGEIAALRSRASRTLRRGFGQYMKNSLTPDFHKVFLHEVAHKAISKSILDRDHPYMFLEAIRMCCEMGETTLKDLGIEREVEILQELIDLDIKMHDAVEKVREINKKYPDGVPEGPDKFLIEQERTNNREDKVRAIEFAHEVGPPVELIDDGSDSFYVHGFMKELAERLAGTVVNGIGDVDVSVSLEPESEGHGKYFDIFSRYSERFLELEPEIEKLVGHPKGHNESTSILLGYVGIFSPTLPHLELCTKLRELDSVFAHQIANYYEQLGVAGFCGIETGYEASLAHAGLHPDIPSYSVNIDALEDEVLSLTAVIDVAQELENGDYCEVEFNSDGTIEVNEGWNPLVPQPNDFFNKDKAPEKVYVKNPIRLGGTSPQGELVTGTNMSGKSHYLKQSVATLLMAQSIGYAPAQQASLPVFKNIVYFDRPTDFGEVDLSSYGKDIVAWNRMFTFLGKRKGKSFVAVDEAFSTASPRFQEVHIEAGVVQLMRYKAMCLIATHNHDAVDDLLELMPDHLKAVHLATHVDEDGHISFDYRLRDGHELSQAIAVSERMGGMPSPVLSFARELAVTRS